MNIRNAQKHDYPCICHLFKTEDELFLTYPSARFPLTADKLQQLATKRLALTVIESAKCIVGFANLYHLAPAESVFIGNVIIEQNLRGKGLGELLVRYMINIAFEKLDLPKVCISVFDKNTPAQMLYHSLGFTAYAEEHRTDPNGKKRLLVHMSLKRKDYLNYNLTTVDSPI